MKSEFWWVVFVVNKRIPNTAVALFYLYVWNWFTITYGFGYLTKKKKKSFCNINIRNLFICIPTLLYLYFFGLDFFSFFHFWKVFFRLYFEHHTKRKKLLLYIYDMRYILITYVYHIIYVWLILKCKSEEKHLVRPFYNKTTVCVYLQWCMHVACILLIKKKINEKRCTSFKFLKVL